MLLINSNKSGDFFVTFLKQKQTWSKKIQYENQIFLLN